MICWTNSCRDEQRTWAELKPHLKRNTHIPKLNCFSIWSNPVSNLQLFQTVFSAHPRLLQYQISKQPWQRYPHGISVWGQLFVGKYKFSDFMGRRKKLEQLLKSHRSLCEHLQVQLYRVSLHVMDMKPFCIWNKLKHLNLPVFRNNITKPQRFLNI